MIENKTKRLNADQTYSARAPAPANHWLTRGVASGLFIAALMSVSSADARWYKWVDENGNVSYQDRPPPTNHDNATQVLNTQGLTVKRIPSRAEQREMESAKRLREEQIRRDSMLLKSFPTEADLTHTRDQRIGHIDGTVTRMYDQLVILNSRLELVENKISARASRGLEPSDALESDKLAVIRSIDSTNILIKSKLKERRQVAMMFEDDLIRYRQLVGAERTASFAD